MTELVRIPMIFHRDCTECDCEVPEIVRVTSRHYFISPERTKKMDELIDRAIEYAWIQGWDDWVKKTLTPSARATLKALHKAGVLNDHEINLSNRYFNL